MFSCLGICTMLSSLITLVAVVAYVVVITTVNGYWESTWLIVTVPAMLSVLFIIASAMVIAMYRRRMEERLRMR